MKIITVEEAVKINALTYFTGDACRNNHTSERYVKNNRCVLCIRDKYTRQKPKLQVLKKIWYINNRESELERARKYKIKNHEKIKAQQRLYKALNKDKRKLNEANRRARKIKAYPAWANKDKIKNIYLSCPKGMHVDHIIPLQGENVCGLHVENNLQYLTPKENMSKGNKIMQEFL